LPPSAAHGAPDQLAPTRKNMLPKRVYNAVRLAGPPPGSTANSTTLAGHRATGRATSSQREPHEGQPGSQPTQLKILYDDNMSTWPSGPLISELAKQPRLRGKPTTSRGYRRVNFDSYFDRRTGFEFDITSGGSKIDLILRNDGVDMDWNAVWTGRSAPRKMPDRGVPHSLQPAALQQPAGAGLGTHCWALDQWYQEETTEQLCRRTAPGFVVTVGELPASTTCPLAADELLPYV